jgi:hypothetical protein
VDNCDSKNGVPQHARRDGSSMPITCTEKTLMVAYLHYLLVTVVIRIYVDVHV